MAYPYITSGGLIQQTFQQFRKSFPAKVEAETLKKLGIASSNESFVISILKFLHLIGDDNAKTAEGTKLFTSHKDEDFQKVLADTVQKSYAGLFELHGPDSWKLDKDALITFFRGTDGTSAIVGARQANTFATLASLSGKRDEQVVVKTGSPKKPSSSASAKTKSAAKPKSNAAAQHPPQVTLTPETNKVGLTVRIEINLPANGTQETYDNIFRSIRDNIIEPANG